MEEEVKDWLLQISIPGLPGVTLSKAVAFSEITEMVRLVRELLPEVTVTAASVDKVLRRLDKPERR